MDYLHLRASRQNTINAAIAFGGGCLLFGRLRPFEIGLPFSQGVPSNHAKSLFIFSMRMGEFIR